MFVPLLGYARVSTSDQSLTGQIDALRAAGCERVWTDVASGARARRPGLDELVAAVVAGDTVVVTRLDRLEAVRCRISSAWWKIWRPPG